MERDCDRLVYKNDLACSGIDAPSLLFSNYLERSEATDFDIFSGQEFIVHALEHTIDYLGNIPLWQSGSGSDFFVISDLFIL